MHLYFKVALYSFLAREAWVQMARAREYLKKRKTTKINMAARLSIAIRVSLTAILCVPNKCASKNG